MKQDFHDYYSTLPTAALLQIQAEKENYQPEAVDTASAILQTRTIGPEDHQALEDMRQAQLQEKDRRNEKIQAVSGFIQKAMYTASPETAKTEQQQLLLFCLGLSALFLLSLPNLLRSLYFTFTRGYFSANTMLVIASLIVNPILIYLLYKRKRAGWTIAAVYYTFTLVVFARSLFTLMTMSSEVRHMFGRSLPSQYIFMAAAVLTAAILYYLNSERFIRHYQVSTKRQFTTIILSALGGLLFTSL